MTLPLFKQYGYHYKTEKKKSKKDGSQKVGTLYFTKWSVQRERKGSLVYALKSVLFLHLCLFEF